jgi:hypothetical protein
MDSEMKGCHQLCLKVDKEPSLTYVSVLIRSFIYSGVAFHMPFPRRSKLPIFRMASNVIEAVWRDPNGNLFPYDVIRKWILTSFTLEKITGLPIYQHNSQTLFVHYKLFNQKEPTCFSFTFSSNLSKNIIGR